MTITAILLFSGFFILLALLFWYLIRVAMRRADPVRLYGRKPYILAWLGIWLGCIIIGGMVEIAFSAKLGIIYIVLNLAISVTALVMTAQITVYRLRDAYLDHRWTYFLLLPIIGIIFGLILMFIPSDYGISRKLRQVKQTD